MGTLTYISSLIVLIANRTPAIGQSEKQTHKQPFNQLSWNEHEIKSKFIIIQLLQSTEVFTVSSL